MREGREGLQKCSLIKTLSISLYRLPFSNITVTYIQNVKMHFARKGSSKFLDEDHPCNRPLPLLFRPQVKRVVSLSCIFSNRGVYKDLENFEMRSISIISGS